MKHHFTNLTSSLEKGKRNTAVSGSAFVFSYVCHEGTKNTKHHKGAFPSVSFRVLSIFVAMLLFPAVVNAQNIVAAPVEPNTGREGNVSTISENDRFYFGYEGDRSAWGENLYYHTNQTGLGFYDGSYKLMMGLRTSDPELRMELTGRLHLNSVQGGIWLSSHKTGFFGVNDAQPNGSVVGLYSTALGWNTFNINTSTGNIGIGTQTPADHLTISKSAPRITLNDEGTADYTALKFMRDGSSMVAVGKTPQDHFYITRYHNNAWHNNTFLINRETGYIGIGTGTPDRPLTLTGASTYSELISFRNTAGTGKYHFNLNSGGFNIAESEVADFRLFIKDGGNVGIGINNPSEKLDVAGVIRTRNKDNSAASGDNMRMFSDGAKSYIESNGDEDGLRIKSNTGDKIIMESRVGIGTSELEPGFKMTVHGHTYIGNFSPDSLLTETVNDSLRAGYFLWVENGIVSENYAIAHAREWADHVLDKAYKLAPLEEVERFIQKNKHLPNIPAEAELVKNGYNIHDMNQKFMTKIEELTLYAIEQQKEIKSLKETISQYEELEKKLKELESKVQSSLSNR